MPWRKTEPMFEKVRFVLAHQDGLFSMTELCERFTISRKTGYKWLARYEEGGLEGLKEQSRAPHTCPHRIAAAAEPAILEARRLHPTWGARKLLPWLARKQPELVEVLPSPTAAAALLSQHGLVERQRRRRKAKHPGSTPLQPDRPNEVWCADFKGQFTTQDGVLCYPLTVTDAHSRFLLGCHGLLSTQTAGAIPVFERLFQEYGLPRAIRTDNGVPFATGALSGLSKLNIWWIKLGIQHQRIEPGHPEQNGRHERMHRTLKREATRNPERDLASQQGRFDRFRTEYNEERPHEALGQETPASLYTYSTRTYPERLPEPAYPGHLQRRWVSKAGNFRFHQGRQLFLSNALVHEWIGLEEVEDGVWSIYFYDLLIARFDERLNRITL
jgi:putative transposase